MTEHAKSSLFLSGIALLIGLFVMFGWLFNFPLLIQLHKDLVPMQFNTAFCLVLLALSLFTARHYRGVSQLFSYIVVVIATLTLAQYLYSINIGIDELFLKHYILTLSAYPGRMAPNTAVSFLFISLSIIFYQQSQHKPANYFASLLIVLMALVISLFSIFGYVLSVPQAYSFEGLSSMALHTGVGLFLLSSAVIKLNQEKLQYFRASGKWAVSIAIFFSSICFLLLFQSLALHQVDIETKHKQEQVEGVKKSFSVQVDESKLSTSKTPTLLYVIFLTMAFLLSAIIALCYWMACYVFSSNSASNERLQHRETTELNKNKHIQLVQDLMMISNVFDRQKTQRQMLDLKRYDSVTGLPNRDYFMQILGESIADKNSHGGAFTLVYLDLDDFKKINDRYGHAVGDELIRDIAKELEKISDDTLLARAGGDEFFMLMQNITSESEAEKIALRILDIFSSGWSFHEDEINLSVSVGLVLSHHGDKNKRELLSSAEIALQKAKELGKNQYQYFSDELSKTYHRAISLEEGLREAIEKCELEVYYQPQLSIADYQVSGFEALLRWHSKVLGEVSPYEFIPIAEKTGLINEIGLWVMQESIRQFSEWKRDFEISGMAPLLAINVSALQLTQSSLVEQIRHLLKRYSFNPKSLVLEITETALVSNLDASCVVLEELSDLGIGLAIDDFGTGYSSLGLLQKFPFTQIKIDKSFFNKVDESEDARVIIKAILQLARALHLNVVAEGLETKGQLNFLCSTLDYLDKRYYFAQGYYFSKPLHRDGVIDFIRNSEK